VAAMLPAANSQNSSCPVASPACFWPWLSGAVCVVTFLLARSAHLLDYRAFFKQLLGPANLHAESLCRQSTDQSESFSAMARTPCRTAILHSQRPFAPINS